MAWTNEELASKFNDILERQKKGESIEDIAVIFAEVNSNYIENVNKIAELEGENSKLKEDKSALQTSNAKMFNQLTVTTASSTENKPSENNNNTGEKKDEKIKYEDIWEDEK